jgi:hypothetical protein
MLYRPNVGFLRGVNLKGPKVKVKPANPRRAFFTAEYSLSFTTVTG